MTPPPNLPKRSTIPKLSEYARRRLINRVFAQCGSWRNPGPICAWVSRRECEYFEGIGRTWPMELISYAAACDFYMWQTGETEEQLNSK